MLSDWIRLISMQKRTKITWFFPQILMIKESCNLIGKEAKLATPNQNRKSQLLPFFDDYLHAKIIRSQLIPSRGIDDQRIMQFDWIYWFVFIDCFIELCFMLVNRCMQYIYLPEYLLITKTKFNYLLRTVPARNSLFEKWNTLFSIKIFKATCRLGGV